MTVTSAALDGSVLAVSALFGYRSAHHLARRWVHGLPSGCGTSFAGSQR